MKKVLLAAALTLAALSSCVEPALAGETVRICNRSGYTLFDIYMKTLTNISTRTSVSFGSPVTLKDDYCVRFHTNGSTHHLFYHNLDQVVATEVQRGGDYELHVDNDRGTIRLYY